MNLAVCDLCETMIRPGEFHRLGEPMKLGEIEVRDRKYNLIIGTTKQVSDPDLGGEHSGFKQRVEPVDVCFVCIRKVLTAAVENIKPLAKLELAKPNE